MNMKKHSKRKKTKRLLYHQLKLLAKESKKAVDGQELSQLSKAMAELSDRI